MKALRYIFLLGLSLTFLACGEQRYSVLLQQADSLMDSRPDSAWALLSAVDSADMQHQRRSTRMRYELLRAEAQNKLYIDFTTDSVMRQVVQYYDRRGSRNERLKAHYLLGCCYRDMHEAPVALLTWEDAVACADTTAIDCDYATLYRVYGQMASIYFRQYMPEKELAAREKLCQYALLAGDTLNYIRGLLKKNDAYLALGDTATVFENIEHVRQLYLECGLTQQAAQVYPSAIHIALNNQNYEKSYAMMQEFEQRSGLFDEQGNIAKTREKYYFEKGRYLAGIGKLDSSAIYFRKLIPHDDSRLDGYHALLALFISLNQNDSVQKYSQLCDQELAYYLKRTKIEAISQAEAMYDFDKQMQIAQEQERKANNWIIGGISAMLVISIIAFIIYLYYKKATEEKVKKEQELRLLMETYYMTLEHLNTAQTEAQILQRSLSGKDEAIERLSKEKTEQVMQLEVLVEDLHTQIDKLQDTAARLSSKESKLVSHFQYIAKSHSQKDNNGNITIISERCASSEEWELMLEMVLECHPNFYLVLKEHNLAESQIKVCILSRYGFNNADISTLIPLDIKYVSNIRTRIARDTFHLCSAYDLNKYLIEI